MHLAQRVADLQHSDIRKWTRLIEQQGGINLAQGICLVEPRPEFLRAIDAAYQAMQVGTDRVGYNTYTHYSGIDALREAIAAKAKEYNGIDADPEAMDGQIVVTLGATGAFSCLFDTLIDPGDEVIFFEPFYNYHLKSLALRGGVPRFVPLHAPDWGFDLDDLKAQITPRTKAILVNTPSNPSGKVFTREELAAIGAVCHEHDLVAITDEVYEYMLYDGAEHVSLAALPGMADRTVTVTSFSKTLAMTGWRLGYVIAPRPIAKKVGLLNEFNYACAPSPLQHAIVDAVRNAAQFRTLRDMYAPKRDRLCAALEDAGFRVSRPRGAYYIMADYTKLGYADDVAAVEGLIERVGVGAVPGSAFFAGGGKGRNLLRFCFAFHQDGLEEAGRRLRALRHA